MATGKDASAEEETPPNFNEWGNPLFLPNNGDNRGSDPGYSMSYHQTSVPFRHIEDIVSRLGKVRHQSLAAIAELTFTQTVFHRRQLHMRADACTNLRIGVMTS